MYRLVVRAQNAGSWQQCAEVPALAGVMAYGATREEALAKAQALALRVLAERLENGEPTPELAGLFAAA